VNNPLLTFINLAYPFLLGTIALIFQIFIRRSQPDPSKPHSIKIRDLLGLIEVEIPVRGLWIIRAVLVVVALGFFSLPAFRDDNALKQFTTNELGDLSIAEDWRTQRNEYISSLNKVLEGIKNPFRFASTPGTVRSKGENYFEVRKVESWGWQRYRIVAGKGSVTHLYEVPQQLPKTIRSDFELRETDSNNIEMSLADIYFKWTKVIKPEYKQEFVLSPDNTLYSHDLTALTRVRFFPYLDISKTVYLIRSKIPGKYVPIGYAIYYPD